LGKKKKTTLLRTYGLKKRGGLGDKERANQRKSLLKSCLCQTGAGPAAGGFRKTQTATGGKKRRGAWPKKKKEKFPWGKGVGEGL